MQNLSKRYVSWLELFYDLAFVALIAQFTYVIAGMERSFFSGVLVLMVGYMIFVAWWGTTVSRNIQNSENTKDRVLVQVQMVFALLMSIYLPDVLLGGSPFWFFLSYAIIRGTQVFAILRMYYVFPDMRPHTFNVVQGSAIAVILWVIAGLVTVPFAYVLATSALALDLLSPLTKGEGNKIRMLDIHHLQERLGLFLLLVMGESMLVVAISNTSVSTDFVRPFIVFSGVLYMIFLWWLYFSHLDAEARGRQPKNLFAYLQGHAFLFGSIVLVAAAHKNFLLDPAFRVNNVLLLTSGSVLMLASLFVIRWMAVGIHPVRTMVSLVTIIGITAIGFFSIRLESYFFVIAGSVLLIGVYTLWDEIRRLKKGIQHEKTSA